MAGFFASIAAWFGKTPEQPREPMLIERPVRRHAVEEADEPRFRTSATDRTEDEETAGRRLRIREAFMPSQPIASRRMFAGRRDLLRQLIQAVEDERAHIVLWGKRGIGKTSLLRVFTEIASKAGYLVVHENCGSASQFDELFRTICARVPLLYHGAIAPSEAQAQEGGTLADLLPPGEVGPRQVSRLLAELAGTRFIIVLDEFDRVERSNFQAEVAELIKNLSDASARVQLVIAGVAQNLQDLLGHSPSIRRNVVAVGMERMGDQEIAEIVAIGERHSDLRFEPAATQAIVQTAHGFPYLARLLAHHAAIAALGKGRSDIIVADVTESIAYTVAAMEARFSTGLRDALRYWVAAEPRKMFEIARAGMDEGRSIDVAQIARNSESSLEQTRSVLDRVSETEQFLARVPDQPGRYMLNEEEGLVGFLLLATAARAASTRV